MSEEKESLPTSPEPYWRESVELPSFPELKENLHVDVVIVGGGITGITTAYLLVKEGLKVAILEAGRLLNGTTGHTTAKITAQHNLIYDEFIEHLGQSKARMYYEANTEALHFIQNTVNELEIDCDFSNQDAFLYATTEKYARKIEKELKAYQKLHIRGELTEDIPFNINIHNALVMKNQAQFHPLKYLTHIVKTITEAGGLIFENTTAVNIEKNQGKTAVLTRGGLKVTGSHVLACSHFPFYEGTGFYSTRMYASRSYVLGVKADFEYPGGMYLSVDQPTRSIRSTKMNGETLIIIGGDSHKTGQGKDTLLHYKALETFTKDTLGLDQIIYRWSAQDLITLDKLPYIGPITSNEPHVLIATGFRKWGMTSSTVAALLFRDYVVEKQNPYKELFSPSRFYADPSLKNFFIENFDVSKHLIKGKMEHPLKQPNSLANDEGAVVSINGERKGAYKDAEGKLHIVDTTCTHIGCEVNWNHGDRTWDCPCHGSRFSYTGEVVEGPAEKPLKKYDYSMMENFTSEESGY